MRGSALGKKPPGPWKTVLEWVGPGVCVADGVGSTWAWLGSLCGPHQGGAGLVSGQAGQMGAAPESRVGAWPGDLGRT